MTKRFISMTLFVFLLWCLPGRAQHYSVIGEEWLGVVDLETGEMVVDSLYQAVEIFDDLYFECMFDRYVTDDGQWHILPGYVSETYDAQGVMVSRSFAPLLENDTPPFSATLAFAKAFGLKSLEAQVKFQQAIDYESHNMRREALQCYVAAYRLCPEMTAAKACALAVRESMDQDLQDVRLQIYNEKQQREIERAQSQAAMAALQATLEGAAGMLVQIQARQRAAANRAAAAQTSSRKSESSDKRVSSTDSGGKASTAEDNLRDVRKGQGKRKAKSAKWNLLEKKWITCTLCHGSGRCTFCTGGKVNGRACNYCHGSNVCGRCNGIKKIYQ